ncbi:MAG TPA: hypothetical protein VF690_17255 [Hymenobacter sp.]
MSGLYRKNAEHVATLLFAAEKFATDGSGALRTPEIARLLTAGGVPPARVTAAGRGQYVPVASNDSPKARP